MRGTPFLSEGFVGGLNTVADPYQVEATEARELMNVVSTQRGSIRKRYGSTQVLETLPPTELNTIFAATISGVPWLIIAGGGKIYSVSAGGVVTEIGKGFSGQPFSIVQAPISKEIGSQGPIYLTNGNNFPVYWTGAGEVQVWRGAASVKIGEQPLIECWETEPHVPYGQYMIFAGNRIWMTGLGGDPSAVWFTEAVSIGEGGGQADPSFWPKTNVVRFDSSDGQPITGIGTVGPYILVFKERKTWVIHNLNTGENRKLADSTGCVAHRSIVESGQGTFFLTADQGVYITDGSKLSEVSYNVRPTVLEINPAQRQNAAGGFFANHYYLSYAAGLSEVNNRTLDYDLQLKSWWLHDLAANRWTTWEPTTGATGLYATPSKAGVAAGVVKCFVPGIYTDSGQNYTGNGTLGAYWIGYWDPFAYYVFRHRIKAPMLKKRIRQVWFAGEGQIVPMLFKNFHVGGREEKAVVDNLEISTEAKLPTDFSGASEKFGEGSGFFGEGEGIFGGETIVGQARIYAAGVCNVLSVGWGNNSEMGFTIDAFTAMISFRKS
jgi:hypothetical protein